MSRSTSVLALLKQPFLAVAHKYNAVAQQRPMATGLITTVVKTSAADLFAQTVMERKEWKDIDWKRHAVFCSFGFAYLGGFQYYLYNHLFVKWCAGITAVVGHRGSAPVKTFIDQAIHHPFCYFPVLYMMKGFAEDRPLASTFTKYKDELWENCKALWMIWVPAQMVNFTVVPRHLRIPYVAGVSFLWTVIISVMRGALEVPSAPTTQQLEEAAAAVAAAAAAPVAAATAAAAAPVAAALAAAAAPAAVQRCGVDAGSAGAVGTGGLGLKALVASPREASRP